MASAMALHLVSTATQRRTPSPKVKSARRFSRHHRRHVERNWKMTFRKFFLKVFNKVYPFILFSSFDPGRRPPNSLRPPVVCSIPRGRRSIGYRVILKLVRRRVFSVLNTACDRRRQVYSVKIKTVVVYRSTTRVHKCR